MTIVAIPAVDLPVAETIAPDDLVVIIGADGKARRTTASQLAAGTVAAVTSVNGATGAVVVATAAQGALADSALQPADAVAFATAAQGALADTALQPGEAWDATTPVYDFGGVIRADGAVLASAAGAVALDLGGEPVKRLTLDEATTITLSNPTAGQDVLVRITQGATGGAAAWAGVTKWDGGAAPTLGTAAGDVDDILLSVQPDGVTVLGKHTAGYR